MSREFDTAPNIRIEFKPILYELYAKYSFPQYRGRDIGDLRFMYQYVPSHSLVTLVNNLVTDLAPVLRKAKQERVAIFYKHNLTKNLSVELGTVKFEGEYDSLWKINVRI